MHDSESLLGFSLNILLEKLWQHTEPTLGFDCLAYSMQKGERSEKKFEFHLFLKLFEFEQREEEVSGFTLQLWGGSHLLRG